MNGLQAPVKCSQFDKEGTLLASVYVDAPYAEILLESGAASFELEGKAEIFEIAVR